MDREIKIIALKGKIDDAEHTHFACGLLVDMAQDDLDKAKAAQRESRNKLFELREQLHKLEAASA